MSSPTTPSRLIFTSNTFPRHLHAAHFLLSYRGGRAAGPSPTLRPPGKPSPPAPCAARPSGLRCPGERDNKGGSVGPGSRVPPPGPRRRGEPPGDSAARTRPRPPPGPAGPASFPRTRPGLPPWTQPAPASRPPPRAPDVTAPAPSAPARGAGRSQDGGLGEGASGPRRHLPK